MTGTIRGGSRKRSKCGIAIKNGTKGGGLAKEPFRARTSDYGRRSPLSFRKIRKRWRSLLQNGVSIMRILGREKRGKYLNEKKGIC